MQLLTLQLPDLSVNYGHIQSAVRRAAGERTEGANEWNWLNDDPAENVDRVEFLHDMFILAAEVQGLFGEARIEGGIITIEGAEGRSVIFRVRLLSPYADDSALWSTLALSFVHDLRATSLLVEPSGRTTFELAVETLRRIGHEASAMLAALGTE